MNSATWGALRALKDGDTRYQLTPDPSGEASKRLFGVAVYVSSHVGTVVIVTDMSMVAVGVRDGVTMSVDASRFADYDQSLVRMTVAPRRRHAAPAIVEIITPGGVAGTARGEKTTDTPASATDNAGKK